ncbi:putative mediator of RNA polymerase II transcription subunit 29 [Teleopsis dalmanni]|uniref:putative mediator of RNA polymerase II transcription subunit 29 n=2 Tax=Teleopsis dalmanni TaxID=139649 RepID=UPI0018CCB421|nr:putative mediator of RNA polymerase II transcription subunit 29 [Teleopsis dalmanni]
MSPAHVSSPLTLSTSQQQQPQTPSTPSHHLNSILNETANSNDSSTLAVAANDSNNSNNSSSNSSTNSIVNNQPTMPLQNTMRLISMTPVRVEDIHSLGPVSPVRNQQQSNQQHNQSIDKQTTAEVNKIATSKTASLSKPSIIQSTQCRIYPDKHSVKLRENLQEQAPCKCLVPPSHDPKANKEIQEFQIPEAQRQRNLKHIEENPKVFSLQRYTQDREESQTQIQKAQRQQRPRYIKQNPEVFHPIRVIPDQVQAHEIQPQQVPQHVTPIEENKPETLMADDLETKFKRTAARVQQQLKKLVKNKPRSLYLPIAMEQTAKQDKNKLRKNQPGKKEQTMEDVQIQPTIRPSDRKMLPKAIGWRCKKTHQNNSDTQSHRDPTRAPAASTTVKIDNDDQDVLQCTWNDVVDEQNRSPPPPVIDELYSELLKNAAESQPSVADTVRKLVDKYPPEVSQAICDARRKRGAGKRINFQRVVEGKAYQVKISRKGVIKVWVK